MSSKYFTAEAVLKILLFLLFVHLNTLLIRYNHFSGIGHFNENHNHFIENPKVDLYHFVENAILSLRQKLLHQ